MWKRWCDDFSIVKAHTERHLPEVETDCQLYSICVYNVINKFVHAFSGGFVFCRTLNFVHFWEEPLPHLKCPVN